MSTGGAPAGPAGAQGGTGAGAAGTAPPPAAGGDQGAQGGTGVPEGFIPRSRLNEEAAARRTAEAELQRIRDATAQAEEAQKTEAERWKGEAERAQAQVKALNDQLAVNGRQQHFRDAAAGKIQPEMMSAALKLVTLDGVTDERTAGDAVTDALKAYPFLAAQGGGAPAGGAAGGNGNGGAPAGGQQQQGGIFQPPAGAAEQMTDEQRARASVLLGPGGMSNLERQAVAQGAAPAQGAGPRQLGAPMAGGAPAGATVPLDDAQQRAGFGAWLAGNVFARGGQPQQ